MYTIRQNTQKCCIHHNGPRSYSSTPCMKAMKSKIKPHVVSCHVQKDIYKDQNKVPSCSTCANCFITFDPITEKQEHKCSLIVNNYDIVSGKIDYISSKVMREEGSCEHHGVFFVPQNIFERVYFMWHHFTLSPYFKETRAFLLLVFYMFFLLFLAFYQI